MRGIREERLGGRLARLHRARLRAADQRLGPNFSHPFVLHYPGNGHPADTPRPVLNTWNLQKYSNGTVFDNELWGANFGVLR